MDARLSITNGGWLRGSKQATASSRDLCPLSITNGGWLRGSRTMVDGSLEMCFSPSPTGDGSVEATWSAGRNHEAQRLSITNGGWLRGSPVASASASARGRSLHHQRVMAPLKPGARGGHGPRGPGSPSPTGDGSVEARGHGRDPRRSSRLSITNGGWLRGSINLPDEETRQRCALHHQRVMAPLKHHLRRLRTRSRHHLSITNGGWLRGSLASELWVDGEGRLSITNGGWLRGSLAEKARAEAFARHSPSPTGDGSVEAGAATID